MKPNKENIITEILIQLNAGTTYTDCLDLIDMTWSLPSTTFKRYWKEANSRYVTVNQTAQKEISDQMLDSAKERLKTAILTKNERMDILSQIARGELTYQKEVVTKLGPMTITAKPDFNDRKGAVAELNKMEGDYAPIKKDITSGGEPLKQITGIIVE